MNGYYLNIWQLNDLIQNAPDNLLNRYPNISKLPKDELFYRSSLIILLNNTASILYKTILGYNQGIPKNTTANLLFNKNYLFLFQVKKELMQEGCSSFSDALPTLTLNRFSDKTTIFQQVYTQLQCKEFGRNKEQFFQVNFAEEDGIDEGGLFRDAISQLVADLQSSLFILSPNSQNQPGSHSIYIPHPLRNSPEDLRQYEFVGRLIGVSLICCSVLSGASWGSIVWKSLLNYPLELDDFREIDLYTFENIETLANITESEMDSETFSDVISLNFTVQSLDGRVIELIPNGTNIPVDWSNRFKYAKLVENYRRNELSLQLNAISSGFKSEISAHWFLPNEIQLLVEGSQIIDLNLLKFHTAYSNCKADNPTVQFLWNVLEEFDQHQLKAFLKFTSGSTTLPTTWSHRRFTVFVSRASEQHFPTSHTCSWRLDIPPYSSQELLKEKLLFAISNENANYFGFT